MAIIIRYTPSLITFLPAAIADDTAVYQAKSAAICPQKKKVIPSRPFFQAAVISANPILAHQISQYGFAKLVTIPSITEPVNGRMGVWVTKSFFSDTPILRFSDSVFALRIIPIPIQSKIIPPIIPIMLVTVGICNSFPNPNPIARTNMVSRIP